MVGSDVCGYGGNTTETLCARWAMLGAFSPFYRNHDESGTIPQEFYRWESVTEAAKTAIDIRYRMLDYLYTNLWRQHTTGNPIINPMFYLYPTDPNTFGIDLQFFFGDDVLVSPVTDENSTSVDIYLPNDVFYDWYTGSTVQGARANVSLDDVPFTQIPLHIRGGSIIPLRAASANTTTELRKQGFEILIAPGRDGTASGMLYLDEGTMLEQNATSVITFKYAANGTLSVGGTFGYPAGVVIESISVLGGNATTNGTSVAGRNMGVKAQFPLTKPFTIHMGA